MGLHFVEKKYSLEKNKRAYFQENEEKFEVMTLTLTTIIKKVYFEWRH